MQMIPTVATIRDGMLIEIRPKVILLGSEMCTEQVKSAKLQLETEQNRKEQIQLAIEINAQKEIAEIKVQAITEDIRRIFAADQTRLFYQAEKTDAQR